MASSNPDFSGITSSKKWRGFLGHLGPYVIVIGMLGLINLLTDPGGYPWFLWPALGWGVGLAFHLFGIIMSEITNLSDKWRSFWGHFGSYAIITGLLVAIYLMTDPGGYPWFLWPAMIWGAIVALQFFGTISDKSSHRTERTSRRGRRRAHRDRRKVEPRVDKPKRVREEIISTTIQSHLNKARAYREQIETLVKTTTGQNTHTRLQDLANQVDEWTQAIEQLAKRVNKFQQNTLIHQDLETVPHSIEKLEAQLAAETDPVTRTELERTLANRKNQLSALQQLQNTMKRAEIKIESTLSALGTIYPQLLTSQSTNYVADYNHLSAEVDEEVRTLQDHLEALEEVKLGRMSG